MSVTEIEPSHDEVMALIAEYGESLRSLIAEQRLLVDRMKELVPAADDDLVPLEGIRPGQYVKVWGDWLLFVAVRRSTDLYGHQRTWLVVQDRNGAQHSYEAGEFERFAVEEPF